MVKAGYVSPSHPYREGFSVRFSCFVYIRREEELTRKSLYRMTESSSGVRWQRLVLVGVWRLAFMWRRKGVVDCMLYPSRSAVFLASYQEEKHVVRAISRVGRQCLKLFSP